MQIDTRFELRSILRLIKSVGTEQPATLVEQTSDRQGEETHMADALRRALVFRRSTRCTGGGCVEVALLPTGGVVVQDSRDWIRTPLMVSEKEWFRFISCLKDGEFDSDTRPRFGLCPSP